MRREAFVVTEDDISTKSQFVAALRKFLQTGVTPTERDYTPHPGELLLVGAIADYFEAHTEIPEKQGGVWWFQDLPAYLVEAFTEFNIDPKHRVLRELYKSQTNGHEVPDLLDVRDPRRAYVLFDLLRLLPDVTGRCGDEALQRHMQVYFEAQDRVIEHAWRRFVRICYRPMARALKQKSDRSGVFGRTTVRSYGFAGRFQFTFARSTYQPDMKILDQVTALVEGAHGNAEDRLAAIEAILMTRRAPDAEPDRDHVSFLMDASDMLGTRSNLASPPAVPYDEVVHMIEDVIAHWDEVKFVTDTNLYLGTA